MTETSIQRIAKRFRRKAEMIEKRFQAFHGQSSMEHLADVLEHRNKVVSDCECFACLKAKYVPKKLLGQNFRTRNENM